MKHRGASNAKRHINKQSSSSLSEKKSKKVRSLSAVDKALSTTNKMTSHNNKPKFKLPSNKKVVNERSNAVDHASVPRKIRSAMKKRGHESNLTDDSEKVNHKIDDGIESPQKDGYAAIKKLKKLESQEWSTKRQVVVSGSGPITKDEEEVAETLYALAGMFPNNNAVLEDHKEEETTNPNNAIIFEASPGGATEDVNLIPESSPAKISSLNETVGLRQTDSPVSAEFLVATHSAAAKMNLQAMPMMVRKSESDGKVALHDSELCLEIGLNVSTQSRISCIGRKPDVEYETARGIDCKQEQHTIMKYQQVNESPALWPGLTSRASAGVKASYLQSSAAKAPHWLNAAICASKQDSIGSCASGGKISEAAIHKKSWRRCAAHVHISQLIRRLKSPKELVAKEPDLYIRANQGSKSRVLMEAQNSNGMRNRNSSADGTAPSTSFWSFPETKNGIPQQKCHYLDISQSQAPPTLGVYGPPKQSFHFLSLSTGGNGLKVKDSFNKGVSRLLEVPFSKSQAPCFRPQQQQHGLMPIPPPQNQCASTSYPDQIPATGSPQVRMQQPQYYGTPLCGTRHYSSTASYKQQQQSFWEAQAQLAPQGGSAINYKILRSQFPNWHSGRHDTCAVSSSAQVMLPHSLASLESLSSRITQQPFTLSSSMPLSSRTNGVDIHLASVYEESRGRFRSTSSVQLLCDERI